MRPQIGVPVIWSGRRFSLFDLPNMTALYDLRVRSSITPYAACSLDGSTQYLTKTTSGLNTALSGKSYMIWGWADLSANGTADQIIVLDGNASGTGVAGTFQFYLRLDHNSGSPKYSFVCSNYDLTGGTVQTAGTYAYGRHFIIAYYNVTDSTVGISVDGGAFETAAFTVGGAGAVIAELLRFGASSAATPDLFAKGTLDEWGIASAVSGAPTTADKTALYNSGVGVGHENIPSLSFTVIDSWKLRETGATARVDDTGSLDLASTGTPPATTTLITGQQVQDGDLVKQWNDLSGNARHWTQTTPANALTYVAAAHHTLPGLLGNIAGSARMSRAAGPTYTACTMYIVHRPIANAGTSQAMIAGGTRCWALGMDGSNPPKPRILKQNTSTVTTAATGSTVSTTEVLIASYEFGTGVAVLLRNGTSIAGAVSDPAATFDVATLELGARSGGTADYYGGHWQLIAEYSSVHSSGQNAQGNDLLRQEWRV